MAKNKEEIKDSVINNTGRTDKESVIYDNISAGLKLACHEHPFSDSLNIGSISISDTINEIDLSDIFPHDSDLSSIDNFISVISLQLYRTSSDFWYPKMKTRQWWFENVPQDSTQLLTGRPLYCFYFRRDQKIYLDKIPDSSNYNGQILYQVYRDFDTNTSHNPIPILDIFLEQYATAMTFLSLGQQDKFLSWYFMALGKSYDNGIVGGSLYRAIQKDQKNAFIEHQIQPPNSGLANPNGIAIEDSEGNIRTWY